LSVWRYRRSFDVCSPADVFTPPFVIPVNDDDASGVTVCCSNGGKLRPRSRSPPLDLGNPRPPLLRPSQSRMMAMMMTACSSCARTGWQPVQNRRRPYPSYHTVTIHTLRARYQGQQAAPWQAHRIAEFERDFARRVRREIELASWVLSLSLLFLFLFCFIRRFGFEVGIGVGV
jgi:hypothetical protein